MISNMFQKVPIFLGIHLLNATFYVYPAKLRAHLQEVAISLGIWVQGRRRSIPVSTVLQKIGHIFLDDSKKNSRGSIPPRHAPDHPSPQPLPRPSQVWAFGARCLRKRSSFSLDLRLQGNLKQRDTRKHCDCGYILKD